MAIKIVYMLEATLIPFLLQVSNAYPIDASSDSVLSPLVTQNLHLRLHSGRIESLLSDGYVEEHKVLQTPKRPRNSGKHSDYAADIKMISLYYETLCLHYIEFPQDKFS